MSILTHFGDEWYKNHSDLSNREEVNWYWRQSQRLPWKADASNKKANCSVYLLLKLILGAWIFNWFMYNQFHQTLEKMPYVDYAAQLLCESVHGYFS